MNKKIRISQVQATTLSLGKQQDLTVIQKTNEQRLQLHRHEKSNQAGETSHFVFRDDMSKDEEGLAMKPLFTCMDYFASEDAKVLAKA